MTQTPTTHAPSPASHPTPDTIGNTSGQGKFYALPDGVAGWSWGAFAFSWIWAIPNRTWVGLLALIPGVGLVVRVVLGVNGRAWAWQNKRWDSVEHFNRVQRRWSLWSIVLLGIPLLGIVAALALPAYEHHRLRQPLAEAMGYATDASQAVGRYVQVHGALPRDLDQAGVRTPAPTSIQAISIDGQNGQMRVTLNAGYLHGRAFYLAPGREADGTISWRCLHGDVPASVLPPSCRYDAADDFQP
jgi:hypothetical protein